MQGTISLLLPALNIELPAKGNCWIPTGVRPAVVFGAVRLNHCPAAASGPIGMICVGICALSSAGRRWNQVAPTGMLVWSISTTVTVLDDAGGLRRARS